MFTIEEAYRILEKDYKFFEKKSIEDDKATDYDFDNLINFTACREIIKKYKEEIHTTYEPSEVYNTAKKNLFLVEEIKTFIIAGVKLNEREFFLGQLPSNQMLVEMSGKIIENISFGNTWGMLQNYYTQHRYSLNDSEVIIFDSNSHKRFVNGLLEAHSENIPRKIWISFSNDRKEACISIKPSLSEKDAFLIKQNGNFYEYQGHDKDYYFTVEINKYDNIKSFKIEIKPKCLLIEYYE